MTIFIEKEIREMNLGIDRVIEIICSFQYVVLYFFCGSFMFFFCLAFAMYLFASVYMCFVVTCWERADLLTLVCRV